MHIYIDESGNFVLPEQPCSKISCVTALTIPEEHLGPITRSFLSLRKSWGHETEIKGSKLREKQIADTIALLRSYDVLLDIICLDIGHHTKERIEQFKLIQADKLIENLTDQHNSTVVKAYHDYRSRLVRLPNQLFIQAIVSIQLFKQVLDNSPLYYCQRLPKELGNFVWYIDAKDRETKKTPFEDLWSTLLMPILQDNYRMGIFEEGDYSHFKRYEVESEDLSDFHRSKMSHKAMGAVDIRKMIGEQLYFADSSKTVGLQLVDIMSSAFTRAMNGNLGNKGWRHLGKITLDQPSVVLLDTEKVVEPTFTERQKLVLSAIRNDRKSLLAH